MFTVFCYLLKSHIRKVSTKTFYQLCEAVLEHFSRPTLVELIFLGLVANALLVSFSNAVVKCVKTVGLTIGFSH